MSIELNDEYEAPREIRYLGDVQRLQLDPEDVVVLSNDRRLSYEERERIYSYLKDRLPNHTILVLDAGMRIGVMGSSISAVQTSAHQAGVATESPNGTH